MAQLDYGLMAQAKDKDNYQVGADVAKTFEDEAGSITPSFNFGKGSSTTEYPDGAVVDKDDNQIGFSLNGNLFLDDKGKNSLRAGVGRRSTSSDENVTMPEGETVSFSGGENLTSFSLGGDLGNFIFDLSKNISDKSKIDFTSGRIRYKIGDNAEIYLEDTNTSDPTIGYKFSKSFAEGGEVMEEEDQGNAQMEMELMLKEQIDPVSGNTAPLGATPEEVRDDVPINASAGEFMINAQTLNYFGEEFFNNLQETAAEGWERIKSGEESFFRDDELEVEDADSEEAMPTDMPTDMPIDLPQGMAYGGRVRGYAEGDEITDEIANTEVPKPVGGGYGGYGGTGSIFTGFEMRRVKDPITGRTKKVAFFNGRPLAPLESYVDVSSEGEEAPAAAPAAQRRDDDDGLPDVDLGDYGGSFRDKNVNDWTDQDFSSYSKNTIEGKEGKFSSGESTILQMVGNKLLLGSGGFGLTALAKKLNRRQAEEIYKNTKDKIEKGEGTPEVYDANKAAYNTARNLHMETYPDMFGVGFLDGPNKRTTLAEGHNFFNKYEDLQIAGELLPSKVPERTKFDTISSRKVGYLGGSEKDSFDNAIRTGDQNLIRHYEGIDKMRNNQNAYADAVQSGDKAEAARLGSKLSDNARAQADKYGGSESRSRNSAEEGGYGAEKTGGFFSAYETRKEQKDRQEAEA